MRLILAFKIFFRTLFSAEIARQVEPILHPPALAAPAPAAPVPAAPIVEKAPAPAPRAPVRSEALTLLATLQREARLVDFLQENLTAYNDAQIGAAVRDVHRESAAVIERLFGLRPVVNQEEGASVEVSGDAERYRLVGNVAGSPPFRGSLMHHGWEAARCELPVWTGSAAGARVIAPAEVEVR